MDLQVESDASSELQGSDIHAEHLRVLQNLRSLAVCQHILAWSSELKSRALTVWRLWMENEQHAEETATVLNIAGISGRKTRHSSKRSHIRRKSVVCDD